MVLTKYKKSYEKIAMSLLAFMFKEHEITRLRQIIKKYEENEDWQLYLLKLEDGFVGLIGIRVTDQLFAVQHIAVNPSFRNGGIGCFMVEHVQQLYEPLALCTTHETKDFLAKCWDMRHSRLI